MLMPSMTRALADDDPPPTYDDRTSPTSPSGPTVDGKDIAVGAEDNGDGGIPTGGSGGPSTHHTYTPPPDCTDVTNQEMCRIPQRTTPAVNNADTARRAAAQLTIPTDTPQYGPDPANNQWDMIPIGYPIWLWSSNTTTTLTQTVTQDGITVSLTATRTNIQFNMADGNHVNCTTTTVRPTHLPQNPMQPSPTCGYVYQQPGIYTITATATWHITWTTPADKGEFDLTYDTTSNPPLTIGELKTVIVYDPCEYDDSC